jgi:hypothetical protein
MKINQTSFDRWIFETYKVSSEGLGLFRICASLFLLFFLIPGNGLEHYRYLASLPPDFYIPPPGPMMLFDSFPPLVVFQVIYGLIILFAMGMLVGYRTKTASIFAGLSILAMQGLIYSVGKVNHEILVGIFPIIMAFTNWGNSFSVDSFRKNGNQQLPESWPLVLLSLFIGFMMFTAGFPKILGGWLDPSTHAVKAHLFRQFFVHEREAFLAGYAIQFQSDLFWEILDWITVFFEIGFLIAVLRANWFRSLLIFVIFFHFSTKLLMNISFLPNFLAYAAFLNWSEIHQFNQQKVQQFFDLSKGKADQLSVFLFVMLIASLFGILKWISIKQIFEINSDLMIHESILLFFAVITAITILLKWLFQKEKSYS